MAGHAAALDATTFETWKQQNTTTPHGKFLLDVGIEAIGEHDRAVFSTLLDGLQAMPRVHVIGPQDLVDRTPTVLFTVDGVAPADVATALAEADVAVWAGHSYAVEVADALGLTASGVGVRAGVVAYTSDDDVQQLLRAIDAL
jgi:selenocysteine lyase/cysteine desulfurase